MLKYLLDEHLPPAYRAQLLRRAERLIPSAEIRLIYSWISQEGYRYGE